MKITTSDWTKDVEISIPTMSNFDFQSLHKDVEEVLKQRNHHAAQMFIYNNRISLNIAQFSTLIDLLMSPVS